MFTQAKIDVNGSCLREYLPETLTSARMREVFGKAEEGYWDDEKGYDGEEWQFSDGTFGFTVYARYGSFRIGAQANTPDEVVAAFAAFITEKVK